MHLDQQQGVPAQVEEVVADADARHAQDLLPDRRDLPLGRGERSAPLPCAAGRRGGGERPAVDLAAGGEGQGVQRHERGGHHVLRQAGPQPGPRPRLHVVRVRALLRDHVGDQAPVARRVLPHHDGGLPHPRQGRQDGLDLARLDAEAADLHLRVQAAQVLQRAVGEPARPVSRPVQPRARLAAEGIRHEPCRRQGRAPEVAPRHSRPAQVQLAGHPQRGRAALRVQHERPGVRDRLPDRRGAARAAERVRAVRGVFRRAVQVVDSLDPAPGVQRVHQFRPQRLAGQVDRPHPRGEAAVRQQRRDRRGHRVDQPHLARDARLRHGQRVLHHDDAPPPAERQEQLVDGKVEADGGGRQHARQLLRRVDPRRPREQRDRARVLDGHALGYARAPGGVDHVGQAPRGGSAAGVLGALSRDPRRRSVDADHLHARRHRQQRAEPLLGQERRRAGVPERELQPRGGIGRVQRDVGAAGLEHAQDGSHHVRPALLADPHPHLRPHAQADEVAGQPVGALVQLAVGERLPLGDHRDGVRRALHLELEELVDAPPRRMIGLRPVPLLQHLAPLRLAQQLQLRQPRLRRSRRALQHREVVPRHALDGRGLPQLAAVLQLSPDLVPRLPQRQRQVELRRRPARLQRLHLRPAQAQLPPLVVLEDEHHLEEGRVRQAALHPQLLHQLLERQLLVLVRSQRRFPHLAQQAGKGRLAAHAGAQHQRVDEEADQPLHLRARAVGDGGAHHHVLLPGVAPQEGLPGGKERHERRGALALPERAQRPRRLRGDVEAPARRRRARPAAARAVGGELQQRRDAVQLLAPVAQLRLQHLAREPLPLPGGEVRVLHRQLGERRILAARVGLVQGGDLPRQDADAPPVADDVVHREAERPLLLRQPCQQHAQQRPAPQVEGAAALLRDPAQRLHVAGLPREPGEIQHGQPDP